MQTTQPHELGTGERLLRSKDGWWFLGPSGVARLKPGHLAEDGRLTAAADDYLSRSGLRRIPVHTVYGLTVLTSTDCNLGCGYCFQNTAQDPTGGFRPPRLRHARLTSETIQSVLDFVEARMAEVSIERLDVTLFGGEPLLNPRGCRELLARAADYGLANATMVSNGTLLTPRVGAQLAELGLRTVQITFDGDREQHDAIRAQHSGEGTFDTIVNNIALVSRSAPSIRWTLRINISHHSQVGMEQLLDRLAAEIDPARCVVYLAQVGDLGLGYANEMDRTGTLADRFVDWYRQAIALGFRVPRPHARKPCQACSYENGRYGAVASADGTLSSCWETAGKPEWQVGTVEDGYLEPEVTHSRWTMCGDHNQYSDEPSTREAFQDTVDAALLDHLAEAGIL